MGRIARTVICTAASAGALIPSMAAVSGLAPPCGAKLADPSAYGVGYPYLGEQTWSIASKYGQVSYFQAYGYAWDVTVLGSAVYGGIPGGKAAANRESFALTAHGDCAGKQVHVWARQGALERQKGTWGASPDLANVAVPFDGGNETVPLTTTPGQNQAVFVAWLGKPISSALAGAPQDRRLTWGHSSYWSNDGGGAGTACSHS